MPTLSPTPRPPNGPRLDVRLGTGRAIGYDFAGEEFLVGGAAGCDLRLAGANLPPVACQFRVTPTGVNVRRLTPSLPVLRNGVSLPGTEAVAVAEGDVVNVGPAEITVRIPPTAFFAPRLVRFDDDARSFADEAAFAKRETELAAAYRLRLDELEADYAERRRSLDARAEQLRTRAEGETVARARELEAEIAARRVAFEADADGFDPRALELRRLRTNLDAERERFKEDLARLDRKQGALEEQQRLADRRAAEVETRVAQLTRDAAELEEQVRLADGEHARLAEEADRLQRLREEADARDRHSAERAAQLEAQQAALSLLRARLDRQQDDARREATQLAADRARIDGSRGELDRRLQEADSLRTSLGSVKVDHEAQWQDLHDRHTLLGTALEDIQRQKDDADAEAARLAAKEQALDARSAEFAEQAATLKARVMQVLDLQERLEADRHAIREREAGLNETDAARQALQDQLRKRADELATRNRQLDEQAREVATAQAELTSRRGETDERRARAEENAVARQHALDAQAEELRKQQAALAEREAALGRQVSRLRDVGQTVAAERKSLATTKTTWTTEQEQAEASLLRAADEFAGLRKQAPELEAGAAAALQKVAAARELLRGHLAELHTFATQSRAELEAGNAHLREEAERLRLRDQELERARADHRLAVAGFRQQLLDWQATVADLQATMSRSSTSIDRRQADLDAAARQAQSTAQELARREAELKQERQVVASQRGEMERHLADMRDWYRRKLRELASGHPVDDSDMPRLEADEFGDEVPLELDPGDKQLGELLRVRGLVDGDTLNALWHEAQRQRRTLRQVLLANGTVTLYQLALIEAGNLDALVLGRFRVIDRLRATAKETAYRVYDPTRASICTLRHLADAEMADAVRPDEFRQRYAAALSATHPNLANTLEVTEVLGRPAAVQEWVPGVASPDWPAAASLPGVWVKLVSDAARGLNHAHRSGLVHGRLTAESFVLTGDGTLKILGLGDPPWLHGVGTAFDPLPAADLRALGQVAFGWSQLASRKRTARTKPFPPTLAAIVRRLESGAEPPMADVVSFDRPFADAGDLLRELARLAEEHPVPADGWEKLMRHIAENLPSPRAAA